MAEEKGIVIKILAKVDGLLGSLGEVGKESEKLSKKLGKIGSKVEKLGASMTKTFTVPIVAGFTAAVKTSADFESAMAKVYAVTQAEGTEAEQLETTIRSLAQSTKYTAKETADAAYYMGMAGWNAEQIFSGLPAVLNLATASGEDLATTSDIVTDALTAFGLKAEDAGHFTDVLAQTSRNANTNVSLLGESFKYAAPVAGALGYSIDDIALALGLMANNGIKGSQAGTTLRNIFQRMAKPTKESAKAMEQLGISLQDDTGRMYSFGEIMDQLRKSMGDLATPSAEIQVSINQLNAELEDGTISEEEYQESLEGLIGATNGAAAAEKTRLAAMIGGARAMPGLLAIVNSTEEEYNGLAQAISQSDQVASQMATTMNDTLAGQFTILISQLQELAIQVGEILMPALRSVVGWLQDMVVKLQEMDPATKEYIVHILEVVAAIGPLLLVGGKLIKGISTLVSIIGMLSNPVGIVIAAIAALTAIIMHLWHTNDSFRKHVVQVWNELKTAWNGFVEEIREALADMGISFEDIAKTIKLVWGVLWEYIGYRVKSVLDTVALVIKTALNVISGVFKFFTSALRGDWKGALQSIKDTASKIVTDIANFFVSKFGNIWDFVSGIVNKLKNAFNFSWSLPHIKLPHFRVSKGEGLLGLPKISVDWYRKAYQTPYLFTSPTVVGNKGFGDGGGSGEIVYGRDQLMRDIAAASTGDVTINVYASDGMNVNQLADKVQQRLVQLQRQRMSAYA